MTRTKQNLAARKRGELGSDRGSRRIWPAIDAKRRLNALRADGTRTKAGPFGPNDRRYPYPTRSYNEEGLATRLARLAAGSVESGENEGELYGEIIRRATRVRERAAESLRRSRVLRNGQRNLG